MWPHSRIVHGISALLLLTTLSKPYVNEYDVPRVDVYLGVVMSALSTWDSCTTRATLQGVFGDVFGLVAFVLSLVSNMWATSLVSFKAWCVPSRSFL